jgi:hypothetical protein
MRLGIIIALVGLILLLNASSEHLPQERIWTYANPDVNETACYILSIAPVGVGNLTVGFAKHASGLQTTANGPPSELFPDVYVLPIHLEVKDPANQTLIEKDLVTPDSFEVDFKTRGQYSVYITNKGNESSLMPISVRFEEGKPENREADKYALSIILTAAGAALIVISAVMKLRLKWRL